jgi:hypothetical protein
MTRLLSLSLVLAAALTTATTLAEGAPARLPGVALGSPVLLHAERAAALFGILVALLSVLAQARRGRLPTQLSTGGLGYEGTGEAKATSAVDYVQSQLDRLDRVLDGIAKALDDNTPKG